MTTLPLDGYIRVSRVGKRDKEKGGEGFISPDVQESAIREWAAARGVEVVIHPHELNRSGGTMDRPVFNSIMARVRDGESGGLVVYKTDRFARTLLGALNTLAEIGERDATFVSVTEPQLDYSTPSGRAFLQMLFVFAEMVRGGITESWAVAQRHAVERGVHISPNGFLGYDTGDDGRLVPNADAASVVEVFRRRGEGAMWNRLAEHLDEVSPRGEGVWTPQAVQRLCAKRVYVGEASRYVGRDVAGRGPIVNASAHPALVTEREWQAAQMDPARRVGGRRDGDPASLLAGLARCGGCRFSLCIGRGPKGERLYRCRGKHSSGKCQSPTSIMADALEAHVQELVLAHIDGMTRLVPDSTERDEATQALDRAREDLDGFRLDLGARRKLGAEWHDWLDGYLRAVREAEESVAKLDSREGFAEMEGVTRDHFLALPAGDRADVLHGFMDAVMVRRSVGRGRNVDPIGERVRVLWRGDAPDDLPRPRVSSPLVPFAFEEHDVVARVVAAQDAA